MPNLHNPTISWPVSVTNVNKVMAFLLPERGRSKFTQEVSIEIDSVSNSLLILKFVVISLKSRTGIKVPKLPALTNDTVNVFTIFKKNDKLRNVLS